MLSLLLFGSVVIHYLSCSGIDSDKFRGGFHPYQPPNPACDHPLTTFAEPSVNTMVYPSSCFCCSCCKHCCLTWSYFCCLSILIVPVGLFHTPFGFFPRANIMPCTCQFSSCVISIDTSFRGTVLARCERQDSILATHVATKYSSLLACWCSTCEHRNDHANCTADHINRPWVLDTD